MTNLTRLTISEAQKGLKEKKFSAHELVSDHIKEMKAQNKLNAFVTQTPELALSQAKKSDERLASNNALSLDGIPLGIKDMFCTQGTRTTACSKILDNFVPPYESTVSNNLWQQGAVMLGKTSCDEFAMGSSTLNSAYGPVVNPWHAKENSEDLVPGGSSGGSAAAVAANLVMGATGTDTGGSIRQPASFSGIVGLKPTYGRCSRYGIVAFASSLDQAGPLAKTVEDAATLLEAMASYDEKDSTSVNQPLENLKDSLTDTIKGIKIGIPKEYQIEGMDSQTQALWEKGADWLKNQGAEIIDISLPHTKYALPTYYIIAPAEASSNLARYDGVRFGHREDGASLDELYENTRSYGLGEEVKRRIMIGTYVLSAGYYDAYYLKALKVRRLIREDFEKAFKSVDAILTPSTPTPAFSIKNPPSDPVTMYMNDVFTVTSNLAGLPAISVPAALSSNGLPLGLQLIGPAFREDVVLKVAHSIETAAQFQQQVTTLREAS